MANLREERAEYMDDQELQERVRDYWHQWRLLDAEETGVLDEDEAGDIRWKMSPRVVAALIEAVMERADDSRDIDRRGDEVRYSFAAAGIGVSVQVSFPEWAVPDQDE